jgi:hypothetical protein
LVVVAVRLHQINDVESIGAIFTGVLNSKIVPLCVTIGPIVIF